MLADERAETIACMCYLDFVAKRPFNTILRDNAEHMSPCGIVPFISASEGDVANGFLPLVNFCLCTSPDQRMPVTLDSLSWSPVTDNAIVEANKRRVDLVYVSETFRLMFQHVQWRVPLVLKDFTQPRYSLRVPWPLSSILTYRRRNRFVEAVEAAGRKDWTIADVTAEFSRLCESLTVMLDKGPCFYSAQEPDAMDCLVFGFLESLELLQGYIPDLLSTLEQYPHLSDHQIMMREKYYNNTHMNAERMERRL